MELQAIGPRIRRAFDFWKSQSGPTRKLEDFGVAVARAEGREDGPYAASTVSDWIHERSEPRIATLRAIARVSGVSEVWLILGDHPVWHGLPGAPGARVEGPRVSAQHVVEALGLPEPEGIGLGHELDALVEQARSPKRTVTPRPPKKAVKKRRRGRDD